MRHVISSFVAYGSYYIPMEKKVKQKQNEEYDLVCYILFGIIDEHKQTHV